MKIKGTIKHDKLGVFNIDLEIGNSQEEVISLFDTSKYTQEELENAPHIETLVSSDN